MEHNGKKETREQRFKRIAAARINAILDKMRLLSNCSNRRLYRYSEKDVDKIFNELNRAIREIRLEFSTKKRKKFKL